MEAKRLHRLWRELAATDMGAWSAMMAVLPRVEVALARAHVTQAFGWVEIGGDLDSVHLVCAGADGIVSTVVYVRDKNQSHETATLSIHVTPWVQVAELTQEFALQASPTGKECILQAAALRLRSGMEISLVPPGARGGAGLSAVTDGTTETHHDVYRFVDTIVHMSGSS